MTLNLASRRALALALVALSLIWGYTWIIAKQGLAYSPPFAFAAERCAAGAIALFAILKFLGRPWRLQVPGKTLVIGLVQVGLFMMLQTWALVEAGPGKTAVLIYTMPIWTLLLAWPILGERIRGPQWFAALSTLAGLVLIIEPWELDASLFSDFLGIMAAWSWAIGTILIKRLRSSHTVDLLSLTAWQMLFGALALVAVALLIPERPTEWSFTYIGILAYMSIVSTALCWWLWIMILDRIPAWEAGLAVLGTPAVALIASRLVMGEAFKWAEMLGIVLIGGGLALLALLGWVTSRRCMTRPP